VADAFPFVVTDVVVQVFLRVDVDLFLVLFVVTAHFAPFFTYPISRDRLTPSDH